MGEYITAAQTGKGQKWSDHTTTVHPIYLVTGFPDKLSGTRCFYVADSFAHDGHNASVFQRPASPSMRSIG